MKKPLVSIIMAAHNSAETIREAIESVVQQSYYFWELLIVNDGSEDSTEKQILTVEDKRIHYFKQENQGVGAARNMALKHMKGTFFCFIDADDTLPEDSIECRVKLFEESPEIEFAGGTQVHTDAITGKEIYRQKPTFSGKPQKALIRLRMGCFFGCCTWLIRKKNNKEYAFFTQWTHSEDLAFLLSITDGKSILDYTEKVVYIYKRNHRSAMANLRGLETGYINFYHYVKNYADATFWDKTILKYRVIKIMALSYLANKNFIKSLQMVKIILL